jgi:hypothetical protein
MASKNLARRFDAELTRLFDSRIHALRATVWASPGAAPKVTKKKIHRSIERLQNLAEAALLRSKRSKEILRGYDYKRQWHPKKGKGFGRPAKKRRFKEWYSQHITTENCVYVFWRKSTCLYVGRTLNGMGRPSSHFEKHWFGSATRIDIYAFDRKRDVPRFECMMTHRYHPSYSRIKPAAKKYYSRCPICDARRHIQAEIRSLFRLR